MSGSDRDTWRPTLAGAAQGARPVLHQKRPENWPTPTARRNNQQSRSEQDGRQDELMLQGVAEQVTSLWPTPQAYSSGESHQAGQTALDRAARPELGRSPSGLPDQTTTTLGDESSPPIQNSRLRLNPIFVGYLMGWPMFWTSVSTNCAVSETALSAWRQRMRSALSQLVRSLDLDLA